MASFDLVNYSLRPNKSIQRLLAFNGIKRIMEELGLDDPVYVGLGSIWFSDFVYAHKQLGINRMISIEGNEIGYRRAIFNRPFSSVRVEEGLTTSVLPKLLADGDLANYPWIVWLDYDGRLNSDIVEDLSLLLEKAPDNSVLLCTFNAALPGKPKDRPGYLKRHLGKVVPDGLTTMDCEDNSIQGLLGKLTNDYLQSTARHVGRPGGFVPCFRIPYRDTARMITVGGVIPKRGAIPTVARIIGAPDWVALPEVPVESPPLTLKEVAVLQAELPDRKDLTRPSLRRLGFDLEDEQLKSFVEYYRYYPSFAQINT